MTGPTLTSLARAGGCAAKYSAARLEVLLGGLVPAEAADLLVGLDPADDAAVYRLDDERALVFTVDFFPPVVDDPHDYGAIAATNALNDVFAMGGTPLLALSVTAFPEELPIEVLGAVLAGADEAVRAAGAILAGGHTIRDDEPKYGLAVVGTVHPDGIWAKSGARPGDAVFITKPLGTGLVLQAERDGHAPGGALEEAVATMKTSNRYAAEALRPFRPGAVTDVTGFGLLGHVHETAARSGVRVILDASALPALPGALELAAAGVRTGGDRRNREYAGPHVESSADDAIEILAYDPQTAGGLLVALPRRPRRGAGGRVRGRRARPLAHRPGRGGSGSHHRLTSRSARSAAYTRRMARIRRRPVTPRAFLRLATVTLLSLYVVVTSGAFVRLTASGLGCDNWPRCGDNPYPEQGIHAFVEFGNRLVALVGILLTLATWLAARRVERLPRGVRLTASAAFLGSAAQIPLGGLTVIFDLHPLLVMSHFLLALVVVALATVVALEAWGHVRGVGAEVGPRWWRASRRRRPCLLAAGGHRCGGDRRGPALRRRGHPPTRSRRDRRGLGTRARDRRLRSRARPCRRVDRRAPEGGAGDRPAGPGAAAGAGTQMVVGEVQYRNALPWGLVLVHVLLAATVWTLTVALVYSLWRPPIR